MGFEGSTLDAGRVEIMRFNIDVSKRLGLEFSGIAPGLSRRLVDVLRAAILASYTTPSNLVVGVVS